MKIAVVEFAGKGGLIHYAYQLCTALRRAGTDVSLITDRHYELASLPHEFTLERALHLWDPKPTNDSPSSALRKVRRVARGAVWYREWLRLQRVLRRMKPDVVQFGDIRFATDFAPLAAVRRIAPVMADVCHNVRPFAGGEGSSGTFSASGREQGLYRRVYRLFDTVFVHYDVNVREFARSFPEAAGRAVRIVHGNEEIFRPLADPAVTAATLRRDLGLGTRPVVLFFGTLSGYKGVDLLLDAFREVAATVGDAILVVAGHPHSDFSVGEFEARAAAGGLAHRVRLVPRYIPSGEVQAWMELAAAVVFPYREVFQSGAVHVAQTFGAPIVTTRVGAMAEVIADRESGLVVDPGDRAALAHAIVAVLTDRDLGRRLGAAAARDAAARHSWDAVAETLIARYRRHLTERRPR